MKYYSILFAVAFVATGCSSSNDDSPMNDPGSITGGLNAGFSSEQRATYHGMDWRFVGIVSTLSLSSAQMEEFDFSLDAAALTLRTQGSEGMQACGNGGTFSWQDTLGPFENGTESFLQYDFDNCEIEKVVFDGLFSKRNQNTSVQSSIANSTTRTYNLKILGIDTDTEIKGEWKDRFTCGNFQTVSSRKASFELFKTDLLQDIYYIDALELNNETIMLGSSSENACDGYIVATANDTSTIRLSPISNASFNVTRSGSYHLNPPNNGALGDAQTALLKVTSLEDSQNTLTIQSNGVGDSVTVTIVENGSVTAFESNWVFE